MLWTGFLLGLAGSFHCIGMCGPIAFVLPLDKSSKTKMVYQSFLYHLGRIITYSIIGLLFGLIGKGLYLAGFQQRLSILMGLLMILLVLVPIRLFNKYKLFRPVYTMINKLKQQLGKTLNTSSNSGLFTIGFLNGFLPCGLVYMALVGAISTGNFKEGAVYMMLFGIGTIPMMSLAIFAGNFVNLSLRAKFQKIVPVLVVLIGLLFILRGMGLGIPYISPTDAKLQVGNNPENCVTIENIE